jgi:hypothetical protein
MNRFQQVKSLIAVSVMLVFVASGCSSPKSSSSGSDSGYVNVPSGPSDVLTVISGIPGPNLDGSYGPFATIRRAEEVVAMFRSNGYPNTIQYHNGDGQYVFPRR